VFCHRYPTGPCVGGNPGVRSARDTVASIRWMGNRPARRRCDCQPRGSRELGLKDMTNVSEPLLSRREISHAKEADRHEPKGMQSGWGARVSPHADVALPAERRGLTPSGMCDTRSHAYLSRKLRSGVLPPVPYRAVRWGQPRGAKRSGHCSLRLISGQPNREARLRLPASRWSGAGVERYG